MPKFKNSNATFGVIFKQCEVAKKGQNTTKNLLSFITKEDTFQVYSLVPQDNSIHGQNLLNWKVVQKLGIFQGNEDQSEFGWPNLDP